MRRELLSLSKEIGQSLPKNYPLFLDKDAEVLHVVGYENDYGFDVKHSLPSDIVEMIDMLDLDVEANKREDKAEFQGMMRIHY